MKLKCPKCEFQRFFIKENGEDILVEIDDKNTLYLIKTNETREYNDEILYCLGCSWEGTSKRLIKYKK